MRPPPVGEMHETAGGHPQFRAKLNYMDQRLNEEVYQQPPIVEQDRESKISTSQSILG